MFISEKKLKAIVKLLFSRILRQLEIYLSLIDWLREYISHYVDISITLQTRKIELLKFFSKTSNARKIYFNRTRLNNVTSLKREFFYIFQKLLFKLSYFIYYNSKRQIFINLNVNKEFDLETIIYYIKLFAN